MTGAILVLNTTHTLTLLQNTDLWLDLLTQHKEPQSLPLYSPLMASFFSLSCRSLPLVPNQLLNSLGVAQKTPVTPIRLHMCFSMWVEELVTY